MVCLSVCMSETLIYPAKTAGPIELPFGMWGGVGLSNHVLDGGMDPPGEEAIVQVGKEPSHSKV